jgi:hypothetical protein
MVTTEFAPKSQEKVALKNLTLVLMQSARRELGWCYDYKGGGAFLDSPALDRHRESRSSSLWWGLTTPSIDS